MLFVHYDNLLNNDQDVINAVLCNVKLILNLTYNYQTYFLREEKFIIQPHNIVQSLIDTRKPIIIHYNWIDKPWLCTYYKKPFSNEWLFFKKKSLWKNKLPLLPQRKRINNIIKRYFCWPLGIAIDRTAKYLTWDEMITYRNK